MLESSTVQMGRSVVLDADAVSPIPKIQAVERYPIVVRDPDLRLRRWQAAIYQHQAQLALLPTFCPRIGAWHEIARLRDSPQTIVPSYLYPEFLGPTGAYAKAKVQQRHRFHSAQRPGQVHRAPDGGRARHSAEQHRVTHRQHCLVCNDASDARDLLPRWHDHVHVGASRVAEAMQLRPGVKADDGSGRQPPEDCR
ncbi:hypothetical protein [Micromonospora sp. H61]|uniref:hypothetical protein n=1 Tax=Micromonospora sp. H61 TaxID=2824888 RepID=UPI001FFDE43F|nr:hypothetical protein [Micromonospora sp. H61]